MNWKSWPERIDRAIFGDPKKLPRRLGHAVIQEVDTSNRTGEVYLGPLRGTIHGAKRYYRRSYYFDLRVRYSPHQYEFFLGSRPDPDDRYSAFKRIDLPVLGLRDYVVDSMRGEVVVALLDHHAFSVLLTRERDSTWQDQKPVEFYDKLIEFYKNMHPSIVGCYIHMANGKEYPFTPPQNTFELPEDPVQAT